MRLQRISNRRNKQDPGQVFTRSTETAAPINFFLYHYIVDANNNHDLSDDVLIEVDTAMTFEDRLSSYTGSPFIMLNYEVLYQGRIIPRQKTARIKPLGNMIPPPQNKLSEDIRISITTNEYYTGTFQVGHEKYTLRIAEAFSQPSRPGRNELSIYPYGRLRDTTVNSIDAEFGQPVKVGNTYIRFDSVDFIAQTLYAQILQDYVSLKKAAPPVTGQDIVSGQTLEIPSKGPAYTVLFFWGTWCGPCKKDHPALKQLFEKYADKGVRFIGVAADKTPEHVANYIEKNKLPWFNMFVSIAEALAKAEPIINSYEVRSYPTYFLIDPQGFIAASGKLGDIKERLGNLKWE